MTATATISSQDDDLKNRDDRAAHLPLLRQIGEDLDQDLSLVVSRGGTVWPSAGRPLTWQLGTQEGSPRGAPTPGPARAGRSTARQGQGTTSDVAAGSSARAAASLIRQLGAGEMVVQDIVEAGVAYPQLIVRPASSMLLIEGRVFPLAGHDLGAFLLMGYPLNPLLPVHCWAWWTDGTWIGPRHTNYGIASVCAYEPTDGTWTRGRPLVALLDLISTWVLRHLHLKEVGRWPGGQALHTAHERLGESGPDEWCGCGARRRYVDCHRASDLAVGEAARRDEHQARTPTPWRRPPRSQAECVRYVEQSSSHHEVEMLPGARLFAHPGYRWTNINADVVACFRRWRDGVPPVGSRK